MVRKIKLTLMLISVLGTSSLCLAQKQEINAFKEMNGQLLKEVKKQYKLDPRVELKDNLFFIVVEGKVNKKKMLMVFNDNGDLLTPDPVSSYAPFPDDKNYVCFANEFGDNVPVGIVNYRTGQVVLQPKYSQVSVNHSHDAGYGENGVWRDATLDSWVAYDPVADQTVFVSSDGQNIFNSVSGPYKIQNGDYVVAGNDNQKGLYTMDGIELLPQTYSSFLVTKDGFVITTAPNLSLTLGRWYYGGKTINPGAKQYAFNNELFDLKVVDGIPHYKVHRDDDWISFASQPIYTVDYVDDGQKYYDNGNFDKVIAYYEGEGIDAPHGGYYMGLAAKAIGDVELAKLDYVISVLKNPNTYYYPVDNPENYTFNSSLLGSQFIMAQDYFDTFLKKNEANIDDPRVKRAKKYRGETAIARNSVARKMEDYNTSYISASQKYAAEKRNAEIQQARQQATANAIVNGISNILFK